MMISNFIYRFYSKMILIEKTFNTLIKGERTWVQDSASQPVGSLSPQVSLVGFGGEVVTLPATLLLAASSLVRAAAPEQGNEGNMQLRPAIYLVF